MNNEARDTVLLLLLMGIGVLNVADYFFTDLLVVRGGHIELNPLMRGLQGTPFFPLYKLVAIPLGLWFLWRVRHLVRRRMMFLIWLTFCVYVGLMVYIKVTFYP
ncbi:MAG: hypothetical protein GX195_01400 [Firmicutes bacterium]|nr:hypothetical protein [Bacillota bacterium]